MKTNVIAFPVKAKKSKRNGKRDIPDNVIKFPEVMTLTRRIRMTPQTARGDK